MLLLMLLIFTWSVLFVRRESPTSWLGRSLKALWARLSDTSPRLRLRARPIAAALSCRRLFQDRSSSLRATLPASVSAIPLVMVEAAAAVGDGGGGGAACVLVSVA